MPTSTDIIISLGPLIKLPQSCFFCPLSPNDSAECGSNLDGASDKSDDGNGDGDENGDDEDTVSRRDFSIHLDHNFLEKRGRSGKKDGMKFCGIGADGKPDENSSPMVIVAPSAPSGGKNGKVLTDLPNIRAWGYRNPSDCNNREFGEIGPLKKALGFGVEHILEVGEYFSSHE